MKKVLSIIMAVMIAVSALSITAMAGNVANDKTLKFAADGTFKIIQLSDLQDNAFANPAVADYLTKIISEEEPDLIVLTGDNISGRATEDLPKGLAMSLTKKAIDSFMSVFEKADVPVAAVFGNHDAEGEASKEEMMQIYQTYSCFVGYDEATRGEDLYGCGTYNLPVLSSDGKKVAYNLWMFDSNMYNSEKGGYDHIHEDQIEWYINKSNELKKDNGGVPVPSMAFQHIIVNEIFDALTEVEKGTKGAVEKDGKYYVLPKGAKGQLNETPCPGTEDSQQFEAMLSQGDVKAMFFGHDHKNTFEINYNGIDLVNSPASGYGSYGNKETRGVRVITINENGTSKYETKVINYYEKFAVNNFTECRILMNELEDGAMVVWNALRYICLAPSNGYSLFKAIYEVICLF